MVLKLHGYSMSTCTRLVALVCKEKQIDYELVSVDLAKGEQKHPNYLENQPFGQVPYINDDGFIVYESRAIARYLIKKHPNQGTPDLIPTDLKGEALFEQASSIEIFHFNQHASSLAVERVFKKRRGLLPDEDKVKASLEALEARLDVYDKILGKQRYLAGKTLTLADLQHLPYGSVLYAAQLGYVIDSRPNVARWWKEISERESWLAVQNGA